MNIKKILSIVFLCVAIVMIGFGFKLMSSNKYVFTKALSKTMDNFISDTNKLTDNFLVKDMKQAEKYKIVMTAKGVVSDQELVNITSNIYKENGNAYVDVTSKSDNEEMNVIALLKDSKLYYQIKDIMDEFYYYDLDIDTNNGITKEDIDLLLRDLQSSIPLGLKDKDFTKSSETLEIGNLKFKTTKISLVFNEERLYNTLVNFLDKISNDNDAIKVLQKLNAEITKDAIKGLLNSLKESSPEFSDEEYFTLSMYVDKSNSPIRIEIFVGGSNEPDSLIGSSVSLIYDTYKNNGNTVKSLKVAVNKVNLLELTKANTDKNNADITLVLNDPDSKQPILEVTGTEKTANDSINIDLNAKVNGLNIGSINVKLDTVTEDKEYGLNLGLALDYEELNVDFNVDSKIYLNEDFPDVDVSNAKLATDGELGGLGDLFSILLGGGNFDNTDSDDDYLVDYVKDAVLEYFGDNELPEKDDSKKVTFKELMDDYYMTTIFIDEDTYSLTDSYIELTNYGDEYELEIAFYNTKGSLENTYTISLYEDDSCDQVLC